MLTAVLGWVGTAGTFAAYLLLWKGRLTSGSLTYAALNAVGGLLGGTASALYGAWPSAASNAIWAVIGLQSAATILLRRSRVVTALPVPDLAPDVRPHDLAA